MDRRRFKRKLEEMLDEKRRRRKGERERDKREEYIYIYGISVRKTVFTQETSPDALLFYLQLEYSLHTFAKNNKFGKLHNLEVDKHSPLGEMKSVLSPQFAPIFWDKFDQSKFVLVVLKTKVLRQTFTPFAKDVLTAYRFLYKVSSLMSSYYVYEGRNLQHGGEEVYREILARPFNFLFLKKKEREAALYSPEKFLNGTLDKDSFIRWKAAPSEILVSNFRVQNREYEFYPFTVEPGYLKTLTRHPESLSFSPIVFLDIVTYKSFSSDFEKGLYLYLISQLERVKKGENVFTVSLSELFSLFPLQAMKLSANKMLTYTANVLDALEINGIVKKGKIFTDDDIKDTVLELNFLSQDELMEMEKKTKDKPLPIAILERRF